LSAKAGVEFVLLANKIKVTPHQVGLKRKERFDNLQGSFKLIDNSLVKDKTILLVDDVTTTGATAEVLSKKLKSGGAKRVYLLTLASVAVIKQ
jgi:predicted amidophosphoribosyltransferase